MNSDFDRSPHSGDNGIATRTKELLQQILLNLVPFSLDTLGRLFVSLKLGPSSSSSIGARQEVSAAPGYSVFDDEGCFVDANETIGIDLISLFPQEISLLILSELDWASLLACSGVCKAWRGFALDDQVWRRLFYRHRGWKVAGGAEGKSDHRRDWRQLYLARWRLERRWSDTLCPPEELRLTGHADSVYCLDLDSRLNLIFSGSRDRTIKVWEMSTGGLVTTLENHHAGSILCLTVDLSMLSDDRHVGFMVSGSSDRTVFVWDLDFTGLQSQETSGTTIPPVQGHIRRELTGHEGGVLDLKVDSNWIVSCSKDFSVRVWSRHTFEHHATFSGHEGPVNAIGLQGHRVVSASGDGKLILWDIEKKAVIRILQGHDRGLACVDFQAGYIVSGSNDKNIKLWRADTGECLATILGHDLLVRALSFDVETGRLVSVSYDRSVKVWNVEINFTSNGGVTASISPSRKFEFRHASHGFDVKFDARRIISSSHDQSLMIYDFGEGLDTSLFL